MLACRSGATRRHPSTARRPLQVHALPTEPIARRANHEDGCKGRFWEGRYKCQLLCDERVLIAAMAYVDLNPIRAGLSERLDTSTHTSAHERITAAQAAPETLTLALRPLIGAPLHALSLSTADYLQILDWTGRFLSPDKRGVIASQAPAVLSVFDRSPERWTMRVRGYGSGWTRAAGSAQDLMAHAERLGQRWLKGIRLALQIAIWVNARLPCSPRFFLRNAGTTSARHTDIPVRRRWPECPKISELCGCPKISQHEPSIFAQS